MMKMNPFYASVTARMRPGVMSVDGFMGKDLRTVEEIIAFDKAVLNRSGLTAKKVGAFLENIHVVADAGFETKVSLYDQQVTAEVVETMGRIPCPFGCPTLSHKGEVTICVKDLSFRFTPLMAHLVQEHGFLGGYGSEYRIEPEDLVWLYNICH